MTADLAQLDTDWDAVVVGAGPAGALAARGLALSGVRVLLVDKVAFPRWKVCGCCLNGNAMRTLANIGLATLTDRLGACPLQDITLATGRRKATLSLPAGVAVSREAIDAALIDEATSAGARFMPGVTAAWQGDTPAQVTLQLTKTRATSNTPQTDVARPNTIHAVTTRQVTAQLVIAADGLAAGFTRHLPGVRMHLCRHSRIGAGVTLAKETSNTNDYPTGRIHMAIAAGGYVGVVRLEDHRLNVAAAIDVGLVRSTGGVGPAAEALLRSTCLPPIDSLRDAHWKGTPPLTRRHSAPADARVFVIGDAAGYVEPFTGEGMAWAMADAAALTQCLTQNLVPRGSSTDADQIQIGLKEAQRRWCAWRRGPTRRRRWRCRLLTSALRYPVATSAGLWILQRWPTLARPCVRLFNGAPA